jgi:hypothetical protein
MPRKPLTPPAAPALTPLPQEAALVAAADAQALAAAQVIEHLEVARDLGRIDTAELIGRVSDRILAERYIAIRDSGRYRGLPYRDPAAGGALRQCTTLAEFCTAILGKSHRRCQELAQTYATLGGELYERAEAMGLTARDYRAIAALPADDRQAVAQALDSGGREAALDVLSQCVARQQQAAAAAGERAQQAEAARDEARADYEALTRVNAEQAARIHRLERGLTPPPPWDERVQPWLRTVAHYAGQAGLALGQLDLVREQAMAVELETDPLLRAQQAKGLKLLAEAYASEIYRLREAVLGACAQMERTLDYWRLEDPQDGPPAPGQ